MKKLLLPLLVILSHVSFGQLWTETFDEAAGSTTGTGSPSGVWTSTCTGCSSPDFFGNLFEVNELGLGVFSAGRLTGGMGNEGVWTSPIIDLTGYADIGIYLETTSLGTEAGDYLRVYYRLNTGSGLGAETLFHTATNGSVTSTAISPTLNGTQVQIVIRVFTNAVEFFYFDNIAVTNTLFSAVAAGNWSDGTSWSTLGVDQAVCGCTPNNFTNVVVGGADVISITGVASAASVTINGTADALGAGTLDFSGNFALDIDQAGTVTVNSGGSINGNGNAGAAITFLDNVSHSIVNNGTISIGDLTVTNSSFISATNITLSGSGAFTVTDAVAINETSIQTAVFTNSATVSMTSTGAGALSGDGQWVQATNSTLNYAGSTITISTFDAANTGNTVNYNRGGAQTIEPVTYHHLTLSNSGAKSAGGDITLRGNWVRSGAATFTPGANTVTLNALAGTSAQSISAVGGETFSSLIINSGFASSPQVILNNPVTVSSVLTMTAGNVNLNGNLFTLTSTDAGALDHISGWMYGGSMRRSFPNATVDISTDAGLLPIGTSAYFRPFFFGKNSPAGNDSGTITLTHSDPGTTATGLNIADTSGPIILRNNSAWTSTLTGGGSATFGIRYGGTGMGTVTDVTHLHSMLLNSVIGTHVNGSGSVTDPRAERSGLTVAQMTNVFYIGSDDLASPLPIELIYFNAKLKNDVVELTWATASEKDNDFFTIERATNIEQFEVIGDVIEGKGTTNERSDYFTQDETPVYGRSYYRLKQTDFDGKFSYSDLQVINYDGPRFSVLRVYPNPSEGGDALSIEITGLKDQPSVPVQIYNTQGQKVYENVFEVRTTGTLNEDLNLGGPLKQGLYIIKAGQTLQLTQKIIVD